MCSLFKKNQRGWLKSSDQQSNKNLTRDSLFGFDLTVDEISENKSSVDVDDESELGSGLRNQQIKKKILKSIKKNSKKIPKTNKKKIPKTNKKKTTSSKKKSKTCGDCTTKLSKSKSSKSKSCKKSKIISKQKIVKDIFRDYL